MGESRRRKQLDPNYGRSSSVAFSVNNSTTILTAPINNFFRENQSVIITYAKSIAEQILVNYESFFLLDNYVNLGRKVTKNGQKIIIYDVNLTPWTIGFWANLLRIDFDLLTKDYFGCPQLQLVKFKNKKEQSRQTIEQISDFTLKISDTVYPIKSVAYQEFTEAAHIHNAALRAQLEPEFTPLMLSTLEQLLQISSDDKTPLYSLDRSPFLEKPVVKQKVRNLGLTLYQLEGTEAMYKVGKCFPSNGGDDAELEVAWNGIGDWKSL